MTLQSNAQELFVIDPATPASRLPAYDENMASAMPSHHEGPEKLIALSPLEVSEPVDIEIVVEELPGAPHGTKDPEPALEVTDEPIRAEEKEDANDAKKSKKGEKWDWEKHGPHGFVAWIQSRLSDVPKHSGYDSAGLERAMAYMQKLDNEISKAMRMDLDGELDADKIEEVRCKLDDGVSRLQDRLDKVKSTKKSSRKKKAEVEYFVDEDGFVKEAQKITGVQGVFVTVPIHISSIARTLVNGMVSAGHDIEWSYKKMVERYKLSELDQLSLRQCLFDMGLAMNVDMGLDPDKDVDVGSSDNFNWAANYRG